MRAIISATAVLLSVGSRIFHQGLQQLSESLVKVKVHHFNHVFGIEKNEQHGTTGICVV